MNDGIFQQKQQIQELLGSVSSVGILLTQNQSLDSVAAALSIALILQDSGKNSQVVSVKEPIVEYSSLVGIDQIKSSFGGVAKMLTVSFPYKDGEIDKVSYNIEGDRLNVNLFAETNGINFTEKDILYIRQGSAPSLIITIGVSDMSEVQGVIDTSNTRILSIHTDSNVQFGDIKLADSSYSSLSEIVAKFAEILQLQVEFDVAQNLLDGIMNATHNFTSLKTSPLAFEMAGVLMQKGAVRRTQKSEGRSQDTSLQMLGSKPVNEFPFGNTQDKQGKSQVQNPSVFQKPQSKQFPSQNFPKQDQLKKPNAQNVMENQTFQDEYPFETPARGNAQPNVSMNQDARMEDIKAQLQNMPTPHMPEETNEPQIPTEDQAPSDWFTPKVFKSNKN